ncbi:MULTISPECIES: KUP/HAK/KT family potassium transporter [unclassified Chryseobacterium]|uniref:KUP/HAK/KT family potassium transporter n=1 Tax=unclassified Chryseobacterium TaxID=2593645 RepID=UPI00100AC156|nr:MULTISPECIES: KUP/HAK/KT family potassium transporter [unclassified Chryseobacterium]RXM50604.1 potassium transporter Kup [Chryseobacterium sp. CH25]RXM63238.1 potassium transporter Kup [Chryseobacterium sp. CH1]
MSGHNSLDFHKKITLAGSLIAIGIVFGDIGTSPLYTLNAVFHNKIITEAIALGSLSCIFWTLVFQTTIKYVIITLQADNKGEGGIFSLYALIRRFSGKWLVFIAMAGGAFLMADGIITPPMSVSSAVEGVQAVVPGLNTVPIIIGILILLFIFQQFGTDKIGKVFGPAMIIWFGFIGTIGVMAIGDNWEVFRALNPYYAYQMLVNEPKGFWFLGSIFLCTTGAEALYSDMGHCGRNNIRFTWIFIKIALILCYAGQTTWLLNHVGEEVGSLSPFYHIVPKSIFWLALCIATLATIIASQALISGCFTLINEAIRLNIWPKHMVLFPSNVKGQLYIPAINWFLMCGCVGMVLYFKESTKMEAAFGLSVTLTMLMSTILINAYLRIKRVPFILNILITGIFLAIELSFLAANLQKVSEGGWLTLLLGFSLFAVMYIWWRGRKMKSDILSFVKLSDYLPLLIKLSTDEKLPKYATNLVYLTTSDSEKRIEKTVMDSILKFGLPKRADIYWFVHVNILDEPYAQKYSVETIIRNDLYYIQFDLGFREDPRIGYYFKQVVDDMIENHEVDVKDSLEQAYQQNKIGDFKFMIMDSFLSYDNRMPFWKNFVMKGYYNLRYLTVKDYINFGLDKSHIETEQYPLVVVPIAENKLERKE